MHCGMQGSSAGAGKQRAVRWGASAALLLAGAYVALIRLFSGRFDQVWAQLAENGTFLALLVIGFGVQVALWRYLKDAHRAQGSHAGGVTAALGTSSTASMIACCTHYFVNIVPWLGLAGLAGAVSLYQTQMFTASIAFNLLGIAYLLRRLHEVRERPAGA